VGIFWLREEPGRRISRSTPGTIDDSAREVSQFKVKEKGDRKGEFKAQVRPG